MFLLDDGVLSEGSATPLETCLLRYVLFEVDSDGVRTP